MIIVDLIFNLAMLISVSVLSGFIDQRWKRDTTIGSVSQGLLFGLVALLGMHNPFVLSPGIFFDGRSVVLSLCGLFFGPLAGSIAAAIALAFRLVAGGGGVYMGVSVIISATLIGIIFHGLTTKNKFVLNAFYLYGFGIIVHVVMVLLIFAIPSSMRLMTFNKMALTILGVYPIATALIGTILRDQAYSIGRKAAEEALQESENKFTLFMEHLPAHAFIKDTNFRALYFNRTIDETLGASAWLGKTPVECFPGEFGEKLQADDREALLAGYMKIEEIFQDVNGHEHVYETQKFIIPREGKDPLLGGISIDITDRRQATEALKVKAGELARFNSLMIGRELKMIELKKEINALRLEFGRKEKYVIHEIS